MNTVSNFVRAVGFDLKQFFVRDYSQRFMDMSRDINDGDTVNATGSEPLLATVSRRRGRLDIDNLAQEDIDGQEITVNLTSSGRLIDDDLLSFVNVYFPNEIMAHEAYQVRHYTNPEQNRNGSKIVWVENSQTGDMIPVVRQNGSARRRNQAAGDAQTNVGSSGEDGDEEEALLDLEEGPGQHPDGHLALLPNVPPLPPPLDDSADAPMGKSGAGGVGSLAALSFQKQEQEIAPIVSYHNLVMVQRAIFLVFQGLLAGFSFTTIFSVQAARGSNSSLLQFYQPIATDYRRFFYILSTISLVGSVDLCLTVVSSRAEAQQTARSQHQHDAHSTTYNRALTALRLHYDASALLLSIVLVLLYGVAFVMTLLMSTFDVLTTIRDGFHGENWMAAALQDTTYTDDMTQWKAYNTLRVICSVSGWIGSCLFVWKDLIQLNSKSADLFRLRETTVAWSSRVQEMEGGAGLDQLRPAALKKLLAILKVGTERARDALSFYEQEQEPQHPAVAAAVPLEMELDSLLPKK